MIVAGGQNDHLHDIHFAKPPLTRHPYYNQAMRQSEADELRVAMAKEWDDQKRNGNFKIIERSEVPKGVTVLPSYVANAQKEGGEY